MRLLARSGVVLLLLALTACDSERAEPPRPVPVPPTESTVEPVDEAQVQSAAESPGAEKASAVPSAAEPEPEPEPEPELARPALEPARPPAPVARPQSAAGAAVPAPLPAAPLDLSLPEPLLHGDAVFAEPLEPLEPEPLLPPLFAAERDEPGSFQLGGRLITRDRAEEGEDYLDSVEGVELQLQFRR